MIKMKKGLRVALATLLIIPSFILNKIYGYNLIVVILMILTTLIAGLPVLRKAINGLKFKRILGSSSSNIFVYVR